MKKSANSNMYEASLEETWERFGARLDGPFECPVCVVSSNLLPENARSALMSSARALGYGSDACTFFTVGRPADSERAEGATGLPALSESEVFAAIEGLDPLALVIADREAAELCSRAYRCAVPSPDTSRLLGRDIAAFDDFAAMLETPREKQRAWGLLKRLPRLES